MAVAAAASQHPALSSALSFGFLPSTRVSHTLARLYRLLPSTPVLLLSLSLVYIRMLSVYGLSASLAPEPRSSLLTLALPFTCAPHNAFSSRLSPLGVCIFFISLSLSSVHRFFALPLLIEKERERDEENGGGLSSSSEPSFLSPSLQVFSREGR